ncbi:MAG: hypothetical protein ABW185_25125 [Sedimenticola sp.]
MATSADTMDLEESRATVSELTDEDEVIRICLENKVSKPCIDELLKRGFTSTRALELVTEADIDCAKIPRGQRRLILDVAQRSKATGSTAPNVASSAGSPVIPPNPQPGPHVDIGSNSGDAYTALLGNLLQQQANVTVSQPALSDTLITTTPGQATSWSDPQVHISTAAQGKSTCEYHDICDFVPNVVEEEVVVGGQGDQQLVVKSGSRKPKLENVSFTQWSIANLAILYRLVGDGKLVGPALMDYLSYTTKVYQLIQRFSLVSVLAYDREYRRLQASMGFRWGTDVQHLHTLCLHPRDKPATTSHSARRPQQQSARQGKSQGKELCRSFNSTRGCTYQSCKFDHKCIIPGCGQNHPAASHTFEKN